jgi:hypothetical protein
VRLGNAALFTICFKVHAALPACSMALLSPMRLTEGLSGAYAADINAIFQACAARATRRNAPFHG